MKIILTSIVFIFFIGCNNLENNLSRDYIKNEFQLSIQSNQFQINEMKFRIESLKNDSMYSYLYKLTNPVSNISDSIIIQLDAIEKKINENETLVNNNQKTELGEHLSVELNNYSKKIKNHITSKSYLGKYIDFELEEMNDANFLTFFDDNKNNLLLKILILKNRVKERERELYFSITSLKFEQ